MVNTCLFPQECMCLQWNSVASLPRNAKKCPDFAKESVKNSRGTAQQCGSRGLLEPSPMPELRSQVLVGGFETQPAVIQFMLYPHADRFQS